MAVSTEDGETRSSARISENKANGLSNPNADSSPHHHLSHSAPREQRIGSETLHPARETLTTSASSTKMPTSSNSNSNSAQASPQPPPGQTLNAANSTNASPYGTRSRNRATNRPNYAEDKESEMEFEYTSRQNSQSSNSNGTSQPMQRKVSSGSHGKRTAATSSAASTKSAGALATASKDPIPGTSTFSVNSDSKKRKAPGGNTAANSPAATSHSTAPLTRKSSHSVNLYNTTSRETNMVSFESRGTYLSQGCLIADDNTKYKVNGMAHALWNLLTLCICIC